MRFWGPILGCMSLLAAVGRAANEAQNCPKLSSRSSIPRQEVYKTTPFKAGEKAVYEVSYMGVNAGYGTLSVKPARRHLNQFHRIFHAEALTGDWYRLIFVAHDKIEAISHPQDFAVAKFYMEQDEGTLTGKRTQQTKWLDFGHDNCLVKEKIKEHGKAEKRAEFFLENGATDALSVLYNLRTRTFTLSRQERALVYTSEKNWWLEAMPIAEEKLTVPAGAFDTVKLKLQTYIGQELQQKGDVFIWIAADKSRPLVQVQAEIKIGSVWLKLSQFEPGAG